MASPNKKDELIHELTEQSFREKWIAIAYKYLRNRSDAEDVLHDSFIDLSKQNTDGVKSITPFLKKVITNKAKTRFKENAGSSQIAEADDNDENETTDTLFTQMEISVLLNAVKQYRDALDFKLFEMHIQGYDYEEIARYTGEKAGTLRRRMFNVRNWLKGFLENER